MTNNNMRKISKEELEAVLAEHKLYIDSAGEKGAKADLSNIDLRGANLSKTDLFLIKLILFLGKFIGADLSKADLSKVDLSKATKH